MFQERRGTVAPAPGTAPERESPCDEKEVESYTHMHMHISLQVLWETGSLQGAPDEVLGTPSPLRLMFIIKCPGCSNNQSRAPDRGWCRPNRRQRLGQQRGTVALDWENPAMLSWSWALSGWNLSVSPPDCSACR